MSVHNPLEAASDEQLAELDRLHAMTRDELLVDWIGRLADELRHLRRRLDSDLDVWRLDRACGHLEAMLGILEPTAATIAALHAPGDDQAVAAALDIVDARFDRWRRRLGLEAA